MCAVGGERAITSKITKVFPKGQQKKKKKECPLKVTTPSRIQSPSKTFLGGNKKKKNELGGGEKQKTIKFFEGAAI